MWQSGLSCLPPSIPSPLSFPAPCPCRHSGPARRPFPSARHRQCRYRRSTRHRCRRPFRSRSASRRRPAGSAAARPSARRLCRRCPCRPSLRPSPSAFLRRRFLGGRRFRSRRPKTGSLRTPRGEAELLPRLGFCARWGSGQAITVGLGAMPSSSLSRYAWMSCTAVSFHWPPSLSKSASAGRPLPASRARRMNGDRGCSISLNVR